MFLPYSIVVPLLTFLNPPSTEGWDVRNRFIAEIEMITWAQHVQQVCSLIRTMNPISLTRSR